MPRTRVVAAIVPTNGGSGEREQHPSTDAEGLQRRRQGPHPEVVCQSVLGHAGPFARQCRAAVPTHGHPLTAIRYLLVGSLVNHHSEHLPVQ